MPDLTHLGEVAMCLVVDRRYRRDWPRLKDMLRGRVDEVVPFVDGDGRMLDPKLYDQTTLPMPPGWRWGQGGYQHFRGLQGCVRRAKDWGLPEFLFVEDDCVFTPEFDAVAAAAYRRVTLGPDSYDLLYYGANHSDATTERVGDNLLRVCGSLTTHCLTIASTAYDAILGLEPVAMIDFLIARDLHPRLECYAAWPSVALQAPGHSHIWNTKVDYGAYFETPGRAGVVPRAGRPGR